MPDSDPSSIENRELYELTVDEARMVLDQFLRVEAEAFATLRIASVTFDYSRESVIAFFDHVLEKEFDAQNEDSAANNLWCMRLAYYFGESLRRQSDRLTWGTGDTKFAFANHPVITGFPFNEEAPLITICQNLIAAVAIGGESRTRMTNGVDFWFDLARKE